MKCTTLFHREDYRWLAFGQDPSRPDNVIDTNQVVVVSGNSVMLLDPGGMEVFPPMMAALTREVRIDQIKHVFFSHQDPDVCSSLPLWRQVCPGDMKVYVPWMWAGFVSHFDRDARLEKIPDEGMDVTMGDARLRILPAHYLHSPGNYHVYDPAAKVLFSGDVGAALVPPQSRRDSLFVHDFSSHVQFMEAFHKRWMGSARARDAWIDMVSRLEIDVLAPQHGLIFRGDDVKRFLEWFSALDIGSGLAAMRRGR
ncbi:MBL fold metallo-hydrolase [Telmatospirillum sp. J64-1]|uniref:MBL fold metallo-hydrolase n=1 Tax=Telmatospirillum sp. J64-1 TaxID=2502183 RepID=UPI00115DE6CE|nr:MBL fold metallo-hydrolase [Telmatospirillum sp. J64-1]